MLSASGTHTYTMFFLWNLAKGVSETTSLARLDATSIGLYARIRLIFIHIKKRT